MTIKWLENALKDIEDIREFIKKDSEYYALVFTKKIIEIAELIEDSPKMGRIVPEVNSSYIREVIFQDYRIIYRIHKTEIQILAIIHGARDLRKKKNRTWEMR